MKPWTVREHAIAEVRGAKNPLRGAQLVFESLMLLASQRRLEALPALVAERRAALRVAPGDADTARGPLVDLLARGPRSLEELAVVNCYFAVGAVDRLSHLPGEHRRRYALEVVARADYLLEHTGYSPFEYLPEVAPRELAALLWDALVERLVDEVSHGGELSPRLLVCAEALWALPPDARRGHVLRILAACRGPEAALRYTAHFGALAEPELVPVAPPRAQRPTPPPLPAEARPAAEGADAPPMEWPAPVLRVPLGLRGERVVGSAGLAWRALLLLTGVALLRDVAALVARAVGLRREASLSLVGGALVAEETTRLRGRVLRRRRRTVARPAPGDVGREIPYARLYLLLGLTALVLFLALALPAALPADAAWREGLLLGGGAILAGIALDLARFGGVYLRRGHAAITLGCGPAAYHLAGVPEAALSLFVEHVRAARGGAP